MRPSARNSAAFLPENEIENIEMRARAPVQHGIVQRPVGPAVRAFRHLHIEAKAAFLPEGAREDLVQPRESLRPLQPRQKAEDADVDPENRRRAGRLASHGEQGPVAAQDEHEVRHAHDPVGGIPVAPAD